MTNQTTKTISGVKIRPFRYQFGIRRKKIYDLQKERGEIFELNGKQYICDGFLPSDNVFKVEKNGNPSGTGIYATELVE